ncbi:MAG: GTPase HflX [Candidatus Marinimicrobia bacterium]|nr:GTPase HflX [Candidatus Neomarinimicrobiota bacterium]MCF7829853.1 GTPase HflX [Candidatus Neomarinimicrobiota bacterium]MCF7882481.1 GTPase HflX [Candidatus Neomarinimicrobiota bacterium]
MFEERKPDVDYGLLVGVTLTAADTWQIQDYLKELKLLAQTAGIEVHDTITQNRDSIDATYFIGEGKAETVAKIVDEQDLNVVIFDDDLSPAQVRNLEKLMDARVMDRSGLILLIFQQHARTREAKTQVELARLEYLLPRLTRRWTHLERQVGGIGVRAGMGETQIEIDRRLIRDKIAKLKDELEKMEKQRDVRRDARTDEYRVSLVGYTNAGKSTLMNQMADERVLVQDQLFATLDTTVRSVSLRDSHKILLSDTVGFIRKLPHQLVASFRSTLGEVREADLLLKIVDISHPKYADHLETVDEVLQDMNALEIPSITVFNKIDLVEDENMLAKVRREYPDAVLISAARDIRVNEVVDQIVAKKEQEYVEDEVTLSVKFGDKIAALHEHADVISKEYENTSVHITYKAHKNEISKIRKMILSG